MKLSLIWPLAMLEEKSDLLLRIFYFSVSLIFFTFAPCVEMVACCMILCGQQHVEAVGVNYNTLSHSE